MRCWWKDLSSLILLITVLYLDSLNGKLNGSRKDNMHRFIWTKKTTKAGFRVKPLGIGCKIPHSCLCQFFFFFTLLFTQAVSKDYFFLGNYWYFDIRALPSMADLIRTWSQLHFLFNVKYLRSCLHRTCTLSLASQTRYINYRKILQFFSLRLNYRPRMRHSIYLSQSERLVSNVET